VYEHEDLAAIVAIGVVEDGLIGNRNTGIQGRGTAGVRMAAGPRDDVA